MDLWSADILETEWCFTRDGATNEVEDDWFCLLVIFVKDNECESYCDLV